MKVVSFRCPDDYLERIKKLIEKNRGIKSIQREHLSPEDVIDTVRQERRIDLDSALTIFGEPQPREEQMKDLERGINEALREGFERRFCPRCKSSVCRCRED